jgi:hypothetical protein
LFRFVGGVIEQQYDDTDQSEGKAETVETKSKRTELIETERKEKGKESGSCVS